MVSLSCPHCRHHLLEPIRYKDVELDACAHCGGLWFDRNELDKVIHNYDPNYHREGSIVETLGPKVDESKKRCPHCKDSLETYQFEKDSDLKIDICHSCQGIWLDKGELDKAKIFYKIPEAVASLNCPQCHHHLLKPIRSENVELDACVHCEGLWFDRNDLDKVIHNYDPKYHRECPIIETLGQKVGESQKHCPHCKDSRGSLETYRFEKDSDLKIDICHSCHGIWLDKGELDQAKTYYEFPCAVEKIQRETTWGDWLFQLCLFMPVECNIEPRKFPIITVLLLLINGLLLLLVVSAQTPIDIHYLWGLIPEEMGSLNWFMTLLTHQFLHDGWLHFIVNMYFLYILGDNVEDAMGRIMFPLFYLFCGLVAGMSHVGYELIFGELASFPLVGASGAISGVMAAYMYIFRKAKLTFMFVVFQRKLSTVWYFGIWLMFNVFFLMIGDDEVSSTVHIGGFAVGLLFSYVVYERILNTNPLIRCLNQDRHLN